MFRRFGYGFDRCYQGVDTRRADESADHGLQNGRSWERDRVQEFAQRSSPRWRFGQYNAALVFVLALFCSFVPGFAFAADPVLSYDDMGIVWGPNSVGTGYGTGTIANGVIVTANADLNAALVTLGYDVLDSRLDHDAKAKLSNESTGGAFYTFSKLFTRFSADGNGPYHYPSWLGSATGVVDTVASLYGASNVWWATYTDSQLASAKEDLDVILDGGSIGGGSGGGSGFPSDGDYVYVDADLTGYPNSSDLDLAGMAFRKSAWDALVAKAEAFGSADLDLWFAFTPQDRWGTPWAWTVALLSAAPTYHWDRTYPGYNWNPCYSVTWSSITRGMGASSRIQHDGKWYLLNGLQGSGGGVSDVNSRSVAWSTSTVEDHVTCTYMYYYGGFDGSGGGEPSVPDTNWPDDPDPDYGTPPELPEPQNPIPDTEPGDPTNPVTPSPPVEPGNPTSPIVPSPPQEPGNPQNPTVPTPPTLPNPTTYTGGTYTIDIQGILDAMDEHCIHLQNCITSNFSGYWSSISTLISNEFTNLKTYMQTLTESVNGMIEWLAEVIDGEFSYQNTYMQSLATSINNKLAWLGNMLHADLGYQNTYLQQVASSINDNIQWLGELVADYFESMAEYLHDLFEWLAEQFDFSVSGGSYNDDTVVSWLKKIWSKLGSGTRSRPADPVSDPVGTGGWLDTLFNNLVTALTDLFPGLLEELLGGLGELTSKFPFSIPWDVAALLGLLVAPAECPSVEIPAYTYDGTSIVQAGSYEIDLEEYDEVWGGVRMMMKVAFVMYVLVHTKDFMAVIEKVVSSDA